MSKIILNSIQCNHCGQAVISHHRHDFNSCSCGRVSVDGGRDYTRRLFQTEGDYRELSLYSNAPFDIIRENLYRGSRGKDGDEPLHWVKISEMSNKYLINLIDYCKDNDYSITSDTRYYFQEVEYRQTNNINIEGTKDE